MTPFYFDQERLLSITDKQTLALGRKAQREHRVIDFDVDNNILWGQVESDDKESSLTPSLCILEDGTLSFSCECAHSLEGNVCYHIVALLCQYADKYGESDKLLAATDSAVKDRIKRGRSEVTVQCLTDSDHWFSEWKASSIGSATHFSSTYHVAIRSLKQRVNYCSCPDFTTNQLGTCKHIEGALYKLKKHPEFATLQHKPCPVPFIYLAWNIEEAPQIMLHRPAHINDTQSDFLNHYFDASGKFTGNLPDDFFHLMDITEGMDTIHLGGDAIRFARQAAEAITHHQRAVEIKKQISHSRRIEGINARLYPYQVDGVSFLAGTGRALLADDMGLGKTLQAISASVWLQEHGNVKKIMILCPASLKQQWAREIRKFTNLETQVIQGTPPQRGVQYRRECSFFILNYELLLRDLSIINETLSPDLLILDEAQRIKNWRTKIASAVKLVSSRYTFVLTGTPLENRLEDLYSLMQVVDPQILGPLWRYMSDFHITDTSGKVLGYRNLSSLRQKLKPVMLRRDRKIVSDQLPDRVNSQIDVALDAKQRELHDSAKSTAGYYADIAKNRPLTPTEQNRLIAALQQARMACNSAGLVDKETKDSPKIDELETILEEVCLQSGLKVVIFSCWKLMTKMVESRLRAMGIGYVTLHGDIPTAKRGQLMESFQNDDSVQIFLSTDAGGVGLNLQAGSVLVNLDVPWNPAVLEQRNARIHRLGQKRNVQIITMVGEDSYEQDVLALVQSKQDLFDNVVAEDGEKDVVGVSKKLLETLLDGLKNSTPDSRLPSEKETETPKTAGEPEIQHKKASPTSGSGDDEWKEKVTACVVELQQKFGGRIERILGVDNGLLTILDHVESEDDTIAARLSDTIPVALIDQRTLTALERLGNSSPIQESELMYDGVTGLPEQGPKPSRLERLAHEKLKAAGVLMEQDCANATMDLLLSSLLASASNKAQREVSITPQDVGVWLYSDALPNNFLSQDDATLIMRACSFAQSQSVPENILKELFLDVEDFIKSDTL